MLERQRSFELAPELVRSYAKTFISRHDMVTTQRQDGRYFSVKKSLHMGLIEQHLRGEVTLGVYALDPESNCRIGTKELNKGLCCGFIAHYETIVCT